MDRITGKYDMEQRHESMSLLITTEVSRLIQSKLQRVNQEELKKNIHQILETATDQQFEWRRVCRIWLARFIYTLIPSLLVYLILQSVF